MVRSVFHHTHLLESPWLALEVVFFPDCLGVLGIHGVATFQHNLINVHLDRIIVEESTDLCPLLGDAAKGPVGVDQSEGVEGPVHGLAGGGQVCHYGQAEPGDQQAYGQAQYGPMDSMDYGPWLTMDLALLVLLPPVLAITCGRVETVTLGWSTLPCLLLEVYTLFV